MKSSKRKLRSSKKKAPWAGKKAKAFRGAGEPPNPVTPSGEPGVDALQTVQQQDRIPRIAAWVKKGKGVTQESKSNPPSTSKPSLPAHTLALLHLLNVSYPLHNYDESGPQKWILDALEGERRAEALTLFEKAKLKSRLTCYELTREFLFGKARPQSFSEMADNALLTQIRAALETGKKIPDGEGRLNQPDFMRRLFAEQQKWQERKRKLMLRGEILIDIAYHWTNPIAPLWMMDAPAGVEMVRYFRGEKQRKRSCDTTAVTIDNYMKIVGRAKLPRFGKNNPIEDVAFSTTGHPLRYDLRKWAQKLLKLESIPLS